MFIQDIVLDKQAWRPKDVFCENGNNKKIKEKAVKIERIDPPQIKDVALFSYVRYCAIYLI